MNRPYPAGFPFVSLTPFLIALTAPLCAGAADTTETYSVGPSEIEFYGGLDGVGLAAADLTSYSTLLVGWGFVDRLCGYIAIGPSATGLPSPTVSGEVGIGIFGTPLDSDHVDLDLVLDLAINSDGIEVTPSIELNLDLAPDLARAGLFVRAGETLGAETERPAGDSSFGEPGSSWSFSPSLDLVAGIYWTVVERHQLLLEYGMGIPHGPSAGGRHIEIGSLALGYNARLTGVLELVTQISIDIPGRGDRPSAGFMLGLLMALPSST